MGDLPCDKLGNLVSLVCDRATDQKDRTRPYIGLEHFQSCGGSMLGVSKAGDSVSTNSIFQRGDILFGKLRPRLRKSARVVFGGYCSTDILVLRASRETHPPFAGFVLQSESVFAEAIRTEEGTKMPRCSWSTLRKLHVFSPDDEQQRRIAEILSTLDEVIAQTEALIAKTQQIKAGLMHDLFTRGLTPDGQLRPLREEAPGLYKESPLGWIPKEWEVLRLDEVAKIRTGIAKNAKRVFTDPVTVQYLRVANVQDGFLDLSEMKEIQVEASDLDRYRVLPNDVLMNEGGDLDKLGRGAIWRSSNEICVHQNHVFVIRCASRVDPVFLNAWTASAVARRYFMAAGKQTTNLASINKTQLGRLPIVVPAVAEQALVVQVLEISEAQVLSITDELGKLRLLKQGLMHDLLTGRVRVPMADTVQRKEVAANG